MRNVVVALTLLAAQPGYAATCHLYSKWYYPYPQTCHNNRYTAEFMFHNKLRLASIPVPPPYPERKFSGYANIPEIDIPFCLALNDDRKYAVCQLRIELEKVYEDRANK